MIKLFVLAAVLAGGLVGVAQAQTSCSNIGDVTLCSNGLSSTRIGDVEFYSNGQSRTRVGDVDFYSAPPPPPPAPMPPIYSPTFPGR